MAASKGLWSQCELKLSTGAEPWLLVRHRRGSFWLPGGAEAIELLTGVQNGWNSSKRGTHHGGGTVAVPLDRWIMLEAEHDRTH